MAFVPFTNKSKGKPAKPGKHDEKTDKKVVKSPPKRVR